MSTCSRPDKGSPSDVVRYEVERLKYCHSRLMQLSLETDILLEAYLLHYRNLIEFFGRGDKTPPRPETVTLSFKEPRPWLDREIPPPLLGQMAETAGPLFEEYWHEISQYLQHCTLRRFDEKRTWPVDEMQGRMESALGVWERTVQGD